MWYVSFFFFSSRRRHTRWTGDWSSDVCSSDLVDANPVAQTATVAFDPEQTSVESLRHWVEECGYHCAGRSVPGHLCDPLAKEEPLAPAPDQAAAERADEAHG